MAPYRELLIGVAEALEPYGLTTYLHDLTAQFHGYYAAIELSSLICPSNAHA